ncbi:MAG: hypothetical protein AAGL49_12010 [Pseudomonadota bacterium]
MSLSTAEAVREAHRVALQQSLARTLGTEREWQQFNAIASEAAERVDAENKSFRDDYQARLSEARQIAFREHSQRSLEFPLPDGAERAPPNPDRLDTIAMNRVQIDHQRRIAAIRADEVDAYRSLGVEVRERESRQAHARETMSGVARNRFNLTNQISPHEARVLGRGGPTRS